MKNLTSILMAAVVFSLVSNALVPNAVADVYVDLTYGGEDSGWRAVLPDEVDVSVVVDKLTEDYVTIEITKNFTQPPIEGEFPPISILFQQMADSDNTVPTIKLTDETIVNNTGADWTDYHWMIDGQYAAFDIEATENSGFSINPFTNMTWSPKPGWGVGYAAALDIDGGLVSDGESFSPGIDAGRLYVDIELGEVQRQFYLMQNPTPEPGAMMMLAMGGVCLIVRRRRK